MADPWGLDPMPCSLDPLTDETLAGFLLRLSHRNEQSPQRIATTSGLLATAGGQQLSTRLALGLPPVAISTLARSWRLTPEETTRLTLRAAAPHYPPLHSPYLGKRRTSTDMAVDGSVLTRSSRFCPECLAGDGSAIQDDHGGAWQLSWRLPFVSVCRRHNRILESRCPHCGQLAHSSGQFLEDGRWRPSRLVPNPGTILHPAQCRTALAAPRGETPPPCGGRLDSRVPATRRPHADFVDFQERLLALISGGAIASSMGAPASPSEYLVDLRLLITLIAGTWPSVRPLAPDLVHFDAVEDYLDEQMARLREGLRPAIGLPHDVSICAALLLSADALTRSPQPDPLLKELIPLLPPSFRLRAAHLAAFASPGMRSALARQQPLLRTRQGRVGSYPQEPSHIGAFEPRHVPQRLPDKWLSELADLAAPVGLHLRRDVAIRLVQMVHDVSRLQAARLLDFTPAHAFNSGVWITSWLRESGKDPEFRLAVSRVADRLIDEPLIDYRRRRDALRDWTMPAEDWNTLPPSVAHKNRDSAWRDEEHLAATIYIWSQITRSEPRLHPVLQQKQGGHPMARKHIWFMVHKPTRQLREFKAALDCYGHDLAMQIDEGREGL